MKDNKALYKKIVYLVLIVLLMIPISLLSTPQIVDVNSATNSSEEENESGTLNYTAGGILAQMRHNNQLDQASLGDINPTNETLNLVLLGMRGIAVNRLWNKAIEYKKYEDWDNLKATVDTIVRLQPNFISVWRFQGWNLAYNVSAEWDDYRDRYHWVRQGIDFLRRGTKVNRENPSLEYDVGRTIAQKIGKADEVVQYRRLFKEDDDFHGDRPMKDRDNWLVGKIYYKNAETIYEKDNSKRVKGTSPWLIFSEPPLCSFHYAEALLEEGKFEETVRQGWNMGHQEWVKGLAHKQIFVEVQNIKIELHKEEALKLQVDQLTEEVKDANFALAKEVIKELGDKLTPEQIAVSELDADDLDDTQKELLTEVQKEIETYLISVAKEEIDPPKGMIERIESLAKLSHQLGATSGEYRSTRNYRGIVNYEYWRDRSLSEQMSESLAAHREGYKAEQAYKVDAALEASLDHIHLAMEHWRVVLMRYQSLLNDSLIGQDMLERVETHKKIYDQLAKFIPPGEEEEKLTFPPTGYGMLDHTEVKNWKKLCQLVIEARDSDKLTPAKQIANILEEVAPSFRNIEDVAETGMESLEEFTQAEVVYSFNRVIQSLKFGDPKAFEDVELSDDLKEKFELDGSDSPTDIIVRNRKLLEASFPDLIEVAPDEYVFALVLKVHSGLSTHFNVQPTGQPAPEPSTDLEANPLEKKDPEKSSTEKSEQKDKTQESEKAESAQETDSDDKEQASEKPNQTSE